MPTADEVFGSTYVHVAYWWCSEHHGLAGDDDEVCDRVPLRWWRHKPCHLYQLGTHIDGLVTPNEGGGSVGG